MDKAEKIERFYEEEHPFKSAVALLRELALKSELEETFKWSFPTYTLNDKNVMAIGKFKNHFGVWFFNGVFLSDPLNVLENAQEGKTQAMRHWKFFSESDIDSNTVTGYINEAIKNQRDGKVLKPAKKTKTETLQIPDLLQKSMDDNPELNTEFNSMSPYKRKEYIEYIETAKRESTKLSRLDKIIPMILEGKGLNDAYR
ncbi:MAG: hypothetical protein CML04_08675 [Pseudozobellia sp.]|nr:hypothetical protein [Pseudozobellia sp.]MBG48712.1 hypothetical protein [Pseudozobellia sp.]|tara:strand:+ start:2879 stop:3478 length:600 start_codon:yes stop_codon:yes gene_type:complete